MMKNLHFFTGKQDLENQTKPLHIVQEEENSLPDNIALLSEQLLQKKVDQDDTIWHVIWDFAGQDIYRAIHPIFMPSKDNLPPRF